FVQTYFGLPIWEAGVSVTMHDQPLRVTSSQSTIHFDVHVQKPDAQAKYLPDHINARVLGELLALADGAPLPKINRTRLLISRHDQDQLLDTDTVGENKPEEGAPPGPAPTLPLPPVLETVKPGMHYVVTEVLFTLEASGFGPINWRAFVEPNTGLVL